MADEDDVDARRKRAEKLRAQIAALTGESKSPPVEGTEAAGGEPASAARRSAPRIRPPSPREFVERRMRELDAGSQGDANEPPKK